MRELVQSKSKVIISVVAVALVLMLLGGIKLALSKPDVAHAQANQQSEQGTQSNTTKASSVSAVEPSGVTSPSKPNSSINTSVPVIATKQTNTVDNGVSINSQNTSDKEVGVLTGHTVYDASGNACGIGPTGICTMPFASRTVDVRDSMGNLVVSLITATDGSFAASLKPGNYSIIPGSGSGVNPSAASQQVTIISGGTAEVTLQYWAIAMTNVVNF